MDAFSEKFKYRRCVGRALALLPVMFMIMVITIGGLAVCWTESVRSEAAPIRAASQSGDRLWQTNSEGDDIHIFDARTGALIRRIVVGPEPHGIAASADARIVFVSVEANARPNGELLWIDSQNYKILHRLPVGPEPHAIAASPNGRWVYVPCRDGSYWVVDAVERSVAKRIVTGGRPHNTQISRDGRFAYLSPMTRGEPGAVTVVAVQEDHRVLGVIPFTASVRPPALTPDGTLLLQHVDGLNGFEAADVANRRMIARVEHSYDPPGILVPGFSFLGWLEFGAAYRCHGLAVRPDQSEAWSTCGSFVHIHRVPSGMSGTAASEIGAYDAADFRELASIPLPGRAYWLSFSPNASLAFVALAGRNQVAMIDARTKRVLRLLDAGRAPKRNLVLPAADDPALQSSAGAVGSAVGFLPSSAARR